MGSSSYESGFVQSLSVGDFNADGLVDIAFSIEFCWCALIALSMGNGSFKIEPQRSVVDTYMTNTAVGDFDQDGYLDLAFTGVGNISTGVLLGNGNGTFEVPVALSMNVRDWPTGIVVAQLNDDTHLDIAVANEISHTVGLFFGYGNGSFAPQLNLNTGINSGTSFIAVSDLNNDNHLDIVVANANGRNIGAFLGFGNGSFEAQKTSFTGGFHNPWQIAVGDFNSDSIPDVVVSYKTKYSVGIMFGFGNGTFGHMVRFQSEQYFTEASVAVGNFNDDSHLDIAFSQKNLDNLYILYGDGQGHFQPQTIDPGIIRGYKCWLQVADFNNDNRSDLIALEFIAQWMTVQLNEDTSCAEENSKASAPIHR